MQHVAVVDYGMGNLASVAKAVAHVGSRDVRVLVTDRPDDIRNAHRVVFPGQGAMGDCMAALERIGLDAPIGDALRNKPFLGICVGFQALFDHSEEDGGTTGLGFVAGKVRRFAADQFDRTTGERLKVPHMGWNQVSQRQAHPLWNGIADNSRFYFVHSYYVQPLDRAVSAGESEHGATFSAAAAQGNWFATQFHPEKSAHDGLKLLTNFLGWQP
jgi:imidazole glycerol-phosphate synthase subunit HisH